MGFIRAGMRADSNLKDHKDKLIALQWAGVATKVPVDIPANKATKEPARSEERDVVRARLYTFVPGESETLVAKYEGETLVFQAVIARDLDTKKSDTHIGVLTETAQRSDESRSVYTLAAPSANPEAVFSAAENALRAIGIE